MQGPSEAERHLTREVETLTGEIEALRRIPAGSNEQQSQLEVLIGIKETKRIGLENLMGFMRVERKFTEEHATLRDMIVAIKIEVAEHARWITSRKGIEKWALLTAGGALLVSLVNWLTQRLK